MLSQTKNTYIMLISRVSDQAIQKGCPIPRTSELIAAYLSRSISATTKPELKSLILKALIDFNDLIAETLANETLAGKVERFISDHITENPTVKSIADYCDISTSSLQHRFKNETGYSVSQAINREKIQRACTMLAETDLSCSEIASVLGYSTQSHFNERFRQSMHMTPLRYRKKNRSS